MNNSPPPSQKPALFAGLARILHLHQLPRAASPADKKSALFSRSAVSSLSQNTSSDIPPVFPRASSTALPPSSSASSLPFSTSSSSSTKTLSTSRSTSSPAPVSRAPGNNSPKTIPPGTTNATLTPDAPLNMTGNRSPSPRPVAWKGIIITDYDRILDLVKTHHTIKLDEIARLLSLQEEQVAQELQTLEDNGLVDVKYPAFGEPLIYYKQPEA